jgi:hypothetical protein
MVGRSVYLQPVHVTGPQTLAGHIADVRVTSMEAYSLFGELCDVNQRAPRAVAAMAGA